MVAPLTPGDPAVVGAYRLLGRLGRGGMGTVYLGQPAAAGAPGVPDMRVAVKVVHPDLAADAGFRARFREEVAAARRVAPFCTARVVDSDPDAEPPYLVTEYVDGVSLRQAVDERGPLDGSTLAGVALGVAAALAAIHAAGLVHRDLKPANVLLSLSGPRVIDFGIARALDSARRLTQVGTVLGTPGWMAPEQIAGGVVGPAADVFSWGSLVCYAATGHNPWGQDGGPTALAYRVVHDPPDLTRLDGALRPLVELALRKDPAARPAARDLVLSLLGGTATPAQPVPMADPAGAATAAATQLVRLGIGGTAAAPHPGPPRPGQAPPTAVMPPPTAVMPPRTRALTRHPGGAPPPGPPPHPYAYPPPPPRKRRWYRRKRYLLLLAVLAVLLFSAARPDDPSDGGRASGNRASGIGAPVRDGQLEFVLRSWRCGVERIGQPPRVLRPQGQYCVGRVEVRNVGDEPRTLYEPVQKLFDTNDREYRADVRARFVIDNQTLWHEVNPGNTVRGTMAFDVAEDATPERLEFHDGLLSGGATLRL